MMGTRMIRFWFALSILGGAFTAAFVVVQHSSSPQSQSSQPQRTLPHAMRTTQRPAMKRPLLDQVASTLFRLETARVNASSVVDDQGRVGEPMAWSKADSWANRFSQIMASNGYQFKQWVADIVAGEYDASAVQNTIDTFIATTTTNATAVTPVTMFSFSTCPFCRRAKDYLDSQNIGYQAMELDLLPDNEGNAIRAVLGQRTQRTSMPAIFVRGTFIGGCNDGPGLLPLAESGQLQQMLMLEGRPE